MFEVIQSDEFKAWHDGLRDWKPLRDGVSEMRIDVGPGYRLYFTRRGNTVVVLLCGGDKRKQDADIGRAIDLAKLWKE